MEFLDEDARPRFVLHSKPLPQSHAAAADDDSHPLKPSLHRPTLFISLSLSIPLLVLSLFYFTSEPLRSILLWLSISLLIGPFAPLSITAGDIRVGVGPPVQFNDPIDAEPENKKSGKRSGKPVRKSIESGSGSIATHAPEPVKINGSTEKSEGKLKLGNGVVEEKDWSEGDVEVLRKLLGKHPVGKPGRWEAIAEEGFKGRHRVESVIRKAKELGEKRRSNEDSYQKFLKDRKQVDKRMEVENAEKMEASSESTRENNDSVWSSGEDLALLNALKAFPKDVAMRWEKITAAVPGKTKAACMKRVTHLKRDFRSSKAATAEA
ncbi:PREDICTED: dnaJ homolog subfamily C member 2 [Ipomoea nil]|uniref:dnaJ homolog subfamily C member 2 n=1 Tax=Ipomoea nil TaxID=35883 RepID=UPI0009017D4F|nr:PREDICTED: dnaJ homolog subfamily C member 2 [Ipomoea nil]